MIFLTIIYVRLHRVNKWMQLIRIVNLLTVKVFIKFDKVCFKYRITTNLIAMYFRFSAYKCMIKSIKCDKIWIIADISIEFSWRSSGVELSSSAAHLSLQRWLYQHLLYWITQQTLKNVLKLDKSSSIPHNSTVHWAPSVLALSSSQRCWGQHTAVCSA